ncbi:hypothetical protein DFH09DRAFT_941252 [Mycena vulgaris]|nr:hypothetical protein DFH09DRAFT_941252 [Mycena vulgaris]
MSQASLFSAVVTAFVITSHPGLSDTCSTALTAYESRRDACDHCSWRATSAAASTSSIFINALQFSILVLPPSAVLGAILAKQWLSEYELVTARQGNYLGTNQLKYDSLGRWGVPTIIDYLPGLLIFAPFLFFAGLVYFTWTSNALLFGHHTSAFLFRPVCVLFPPVMVPLC